MNIEEATRQLNAIGFDTIGPVANWQYDEGRKLFVLNLPPGTDNDKANLLYEILSDRVEAKRRGAPFAEDVRYKLSVGGKARILSLSIAATDLELAAPAVTQIGSAVPEALPEDEPMTALPVNEDQVKLVAETFPSPFRPMVSDGKWKYFDHPDDGPRIRLLIKLPSSDLLPAPTKQSETAEDIIRAKQNLDLFPMSLDKDLNMAAGNEYMNGRGVAAFMLRVGRAGAQNSFYLEIVGLNPSGLNGQKAQEVRKTMAEWSGLVNEAIDTLSKTLSQSKGRLKKGIIRQDSGPSLT